jgi:hypothetical protein
MGGWWRLKGLAKINRNRRRGWFGGQRKSGGSRRRRGIGRHMRRQGGLVKNAPRVGRSVEITFRDKDGRTGGVLFDYLARY